MGDWDFFSKIGQRQFRCIIVLNHHAKFQENR